jgi:hypothetical protein
MAETLYIKDYYDAFHIEKMMVYKRIDWRKSPILRGTRYRMLMKSREGRDTFLVFSAIADLVVKHRSLGKLVDSDGCPITPEVIEADTGIPLQVCVNAYLALQDPKIGWLTTDASRIGLPSTHQDKAKTKPRQSQDKQDVLASSLDKSREDKKKTPCSPPRGDAVRFEDFWQAYPASRRVDKAYCQSKWSARKLDSIADKIIAHVRAMSQTEDWQKDGHRFAPQTKTYLNQSRWETPLVSDEDDDDTPKPPPMTQEEREEFSAYLRRERAKDRAMGVGSG